MSPAPPESRQRVTYSFSLAGVDQIPVGAKILTVQVYITSGSFPTQSPQEPGATFRGFYTDGAVKFQFDTYQYGDPGPLETLEQFGVGVYIPGGGSLGPMPTNMITNLPWTRENLLTYQFGFWGQWVNPTSGQYGQYEYPQRLSFSEYRVEVTYENLVITGPNVVWWFGGARSSGYDTSITLTSSAGASTSWAVMSGSDKVNLSTTQDAQTTLTSTGTGFSSAMGDIVVRASAGGATADFAVTSRTPHSLQPSLVMVRCDAVWGYLTYVPYTILDQLEVALPRGVPINEQWTTAVVKELSSDKLAAGIRERLLPLRLYICGRDWRRNQQQAAHAAL